ncbi:hypothetical protein Pelo_4589 [Pelomyxa schiedti]|nr:hypothetical protein Pelo_4589 [Pelomyxa schiedti]
MSWQALCACGIVVILAAVQLQHTADASMYTYAQISALASQFESAVHAAHDGAPPAPTPEQCDALSAAFTPDAQVLSAGYAMTPDEFCHPAGGQCGAARGAADRVVVGSGRGRHFGAAELHILDSECGLGKGVGLSGPAVRLP